MKIFHIYRCLGMFDRSFQNFQTKSCANKTYKEFSADLTVMFLDMRIMHTLKTMEQTKVWQMIAP